jgi:hypothetical protein
VLLAEVDERRLLRVGAMVEGEDSWGGTGYAARGGRRDGAADGDAQAKKKRVGEEEGATVERKQPQAPANAQLR